MCVCSGQQFAPPTAFMSKHTLSAKKKEAALAKWGSPASVADVQAMFSGFLQQGGVFPWTEAGLSPAASTVASQLTKLAHSGHLPINALPQVRARGLPPC